MYHYVARSRQPLIVRRRGRHCNLDIDVFHASQQVNNFSRSTAIFATTIWALRVGDLI